MSKHTTEGYGVTFNSISIGGLTNLPWPTNTRGEIDVTDFDSTGIETLPALPDGGTVDFTCIYDPDDTGQQALIDNHALGDGTTQTVIITAPAAATSQSNPPTISFSAYVQAWGVDAAVNDVTRATFTLRVQGDTTYTDPS